MVSLSLTLSGCLAQHVVTPEPTAPHVGRGDVIVPPAPRVNRGEVVVTPGRAGFVVAAPHGTTDHQAGDLAVELARRTGFGLVIADAAPPVYVAYEKRVQEAARGRLTFYAEIHGDARRETAGRIEVTGAGVDREFAQRLRSLFEMIRDAHLRTRPSTPRLDITVEPADRASYAGWSARREGILGLSTRALHVGMPRLARVDARESYLSILSEFLAQAATLPVGR